MYHAKHPEAARRHGYYAPSGAFMGFDSEDNSSDNEDVEQVASPSGNVGFVYHNMSYCRLLDVQPKPPWTPPTICRYSRTSFWTVSRTGWTGCSREPPTATTSTTGRSSRYRRPPGTSECDIFSLQLHVTGSRHISRDLISLRFFNPTLHGGGETKNSALYVLPQSAAK